MTTKQIESLENMINSSNRDDIILAVQIIYNNKPFSGWRSLLKLAKFQMASWYFLAHFMTDSEFFNKVLNLNKGMKLYKIDSTGAERYVHIYTEKDELIQENGIVGTVSPIEHRKTCKPKNVGKSNQTTGIEQAKLEQQSLIKEKLREGYFKTLKEAKQGKVILPMLAKTYKDFKHKIDWTNAYIQPKLDGMRCLAIINGEDVKLISRQGKEITTVPHIVNALKGYTNGSCILDGELYCHGIGFQNNMKLIKKNRPGETEKIQYWVYDIISDKPFAERHDTIQLDVLANPLVVPVTTHKLIDEDKLKDYHKKAIGLGFEGSIIRWGDAGYKIDGRSENLLKYKDFQDIALKIKDIVPSEQRPSWGQPIFELKGKEFSAGMKYSHEEREEFLTNKHKYIGKTAELRFFEYSDEGIPRFPVMVGIREDV